MAKLQKLIFGKKKNGCDPSQFSGQILPKSHLKHLKLPTLNRQVTMALPPQHRSDGSAAPRPQHQQRKERPRGATSCKEPVRAVLSICWIVGLLEIFFSASFSFIYIYMYTCVLNGLLWGVLQFFLHDHLVPQPKNKSVISWNPRW